MSASKGTTHTGRLENLTAASNTPAPSITASMSELFDSKRKLIGSRTLGKLLPSRTIRSESSKATLVTVDEALSGLKLYNSGRSDSKKKSLPQYLEKKNLILSDHNPATDPMQLADVETAARKRAGSSGGVRSTEAWAASRGILSVRHPTSRPRSTTSSRRSTDPIDVNGSATWDMVELYKGSAPSSTPRPAAPAPKPVTRADFDSMVRADKRKNGGHLDDQGYMKKFGVIAPSDDTPAPSASRKPSAAGAQPLSLAEEIAAGLRTGKTMPSASIPKSTPKMPGSFDYYDE
jgi:hypothetical protein